MQPTRRHLILALPVLFALAPAPVAHAQTDDGHLRVMLHSAYSGEIHGDVPQHDKYIGAGSCSAVACHGGIQPRSITKYGEVLQNEYSTWITADKHAQAYSSLKLPLGVQIAETLKLGKPEKAQRCLVCHAVSVPASEQLRAFDISDGVSCESCHGPASEWLGPHVQAGMTHETLVKTYHLFDNNDLVQRSEKCLTCHIGAPGLSVDHELIAAGHPDLRFELDSFTAVEPPHWVEKGADGLPKNDPIFGMRAWAIGQAVQLQVSMKRVARNAGDRSRPWPEFSEMDCITCHHSLTGQLSWRQQGLEKMATDKGAFAQHRVGDPPYNLSRYVLFRHFADEVDHGTNAELNAEALKVSALITSMSSDRAAVEVAANRAAELAHKLSEELQNYTYDRARTERLLRSITADADTISQQGERTAEQAAMTVDSLYIADAKAGATNAETRKAIDALFKQVDNPSAYNAPMFAAQMKRVHDSLR